MSTVQLIITVAVAILGAIAAAFGIGHSRGASKA